MKLCLRYSSYEWERKKERKPWTQLNDDDNKLIYYNFKQWFACTCLLGLVRSVWALKWLRRLSSGSVGRRCSETPRSYTQLPSTWTSTNSCSKSTCRLGPPTLQWTSGFYSSFEPTLTASSPLARSWERNRMRLTRRCLNLSSSIPMSTLNNRSPWLSSQTP